MANDNAWISVNEIPKLDYYKVLFDGGGEGVASYTQRGWVMIEQSARVEKDANIIAYKHIGKVEKEKIKATITRGVKGIF